MVLSQNRPVNKAPLRAQNSFLPAFSSGQFDSDGDDLLWQHLDGEGFAAGRERFDGQFFERDALGGADAPVEA